MGAIRRRRRNLSLRSSFFLCVLLAAAAALFLSAATAALCGAAADAIQRRYAISDGARYYLTTPEGERLGEGAVIGTTAPAMSSGDSRRLRLLELAPALAAPAYGALGILGAALLFYRLKLRQPLAELREASRRIAENDLDFSVPCRSGDEMGELCASFEGMRAALAENLSRMWRQAEDRRRLNAAFAHDLRTPLTVLRGCSELLLMREEPEVRQTAEMMERNLLRLERYVESMGSLQRLEDLRPDCRETPAAELGETLRRSGELVCRAAGKELVFRDETASEALLLDPALVGEVWGNLAANGARYARRAVTLTLSEEAGGLVLTAEDDGPGFLPEALERAAEPWFTGEADRSEHFGLGLSICRTLCLRHGGWLRLENGAAGARVTAFFLSGAGEDKGR